MKPIIVKSRYGDIRTIELVTKSVYIMYGKSNYLRGGEDMFDFEGGPMLMVGDDFYGLGKIIKLDYTRELKNSVGSAEPFVGNESVVYVTVEKFSNGRLFDDVVLCFDCAIKESDLYRAKLVTKITHPDGYTCDTCGKVYK